VRVEVLDAETGKPLESLGGVEAASVTKEGVEVPVRFPRGPKLEPISAQRVKFRFYFQGLAVRLYAFALK